MFLKNYQSKYGLFNIIIHCSTIHLTVSFIANNNYYLLLLLTHSLTRPLAHVRSLAYYTLQYKSSTYLRTNLFFSMPSSTIPLLLLLLHTCPLKPAMEKSLIKSGLQEEEGGGSIYSGTFNFNLHPSMIIIMHDLVLPRTFYCSTSTTTRRTTTQPFDLAQLTSKLPMRLLSMFTITNDDSCTTDLLGTR